MTEGPPTTASGRYDDGVETRPAPDAWSDIAGKPVNGPSQAFIPGEYYRKLEAIEPPPTRSGGHKRRCGACGRQSQGRYCWQCRVRVGVKTDGKEEGQV